MRMIGHLPTEANAKTFGDYLFVQGIESNLEHDKSDGWSIWIHDEDRLLEAASLLSEFQKNPQDAKFKAASKATEMRARREADVEAAQKRIRGPSQLFKPLGGAGRGPLTLGLIVVSVVVAYFSNFGSNLEHVGKLAITNFTIDGEYITWTRGLPEIRHGEIWRLVTPIFIHMSILHLVFNMMWLYDLGGMVETNQSTWLLALMVLLIAAGSNAAQYWLGHGPAFGGMSGVVYGLLGYIWLRGKFDPGSGLFLHPTTVTMMLIWYAVCLTGLLEPIANVVHTVGLGMGMAWGYLSSLRHR